MKDLEKQRAARVRAEGSGLYAERDIRPHSWSHDWPFSARRPGVFPSRSFTAFVEAQTRRAHAAGQAPDASSGA